jgi:hypothetical protein
MYFFLLLFFAFISHDAFADGLAASATASVHQSMNGISYDTFGDFFKTWHFVTARYRKDTGEMRFTYANDIAWRALEKGNVIDYPEGAAFGKVALATRDDPAFTSSAVPSGAVRYQIMLRQRTKHPETQGWTYALFVSDHEVPGTDSDAEKSAACAACHSIVPERGYVFSQPINLGLEGRIDPIASVPMGEIPSGRNFFRTMKRTELPQAIQRILPPSFNQLRLVDGPLTEHVFVGTLDEIRPTLAQEVLKAHLPAALISKDGKNFSLVFVDENSSACRVASGKDVGMRAFYTPGTPTPAGQSSLTIERSFCERLK